jgi:glycosyltransferase involved in cell wall biosynthesis
MISSFQLVSIIIPIYNRELLIASTLDSIISQTYKNWECIIVDDHSTDLSYKIISDYSLKDTRIKAFKRPKYILKGANNCRNYGFKKSNGDYIQWFDSDDLMSFDMIQKKLSEFSSDKIDIVVCGSNLFSNNSLKNKKSLKSHINPITDNPAFEYFAGNFWFGTPQAIFRRKVIEMLPYIFNKRLKRNQETELFVRILLGGFNISYLNENLVNIRVHSESISGYYLTIGDDEKYILDIDAYVSIYFEFRKRNKLTLEVHQYFVNYFIKCLIKMNYKSLKYYKYFILGLYFGFFPSRVIAIKILFSRFKKLFS